MRKQRILTCGREETRNFAGKLAAILLKREPGKKALVLALEGDLGGGKTTFLQGLAKGLGIKEKILSPTFVIMKKLKIRENSHRNSRGFASFYHFDCYRIRKPMEILDLGWKEIINNPRNIVAVEWADRIKKILPKKAIRILFELVDEKTRKISMG